MPSILRYTVETEAFYVLLGVKEDNTRDVRGIYNNPTESATGWEEMFGKLRERGVERIGLLLADGLIGLPQPFVKYTPAQHLQRFVTHLKRILLSKVRHGDKKALSEDLRDVFRTGQKDYAREQVWERWSAMCLK